MDATPDPAAHGCAHCDDSTPHSHVDERPLVVGYREALLRAIVGSIGLTLLGVAIAVPQIGRTGGGYVAGMLAWLVATGVGLLVVALVRQQRTVGAAIIAGAVATAAVSPLLALITAQLLTGGRAWFALAAAVGWLAASTLVAGIRAGNLRQLLAADTREGEAARGAIGRTQGRPSPYVESAWAVLTAVVFGLCVLATSVLPWVVVVLVPLNVVLAMLSRRSQQRQAQQREAHQREPHEQAQDRPAS